MIIKRWTGSAFEEVYPKTTAGQLYVDANTTLFDANTKLKVAYLPNEVFDSLYFVNTVTTGANLKDLAATALSTATSRSPLGMYWVASAATVLTPSSVAATAGTPALYYTATFKVSDGDKTPQTIEANDWIIITKFAKDATNDGSTSLKAIPVEFAVVNNTYDIATDTIAGIVKLGSDTTQSTAANSATGTGVVNRVYPIQKNSSDQLVVNVPWTDTNTTYSIATQSTAGLIKLNQAAAAATINTASTAVNRYYPVNVLTDGTAYVNVPWVDTNTTYTGSGAVTLTGTVFSHTDTSSQSSVDNSNGTVIQDITLDSYGHVTALGSYNLDGRYYTETELDSDHMNFYVSASQPSTTKTGAIWFSI